VRLALDDFGIGYSSLGRLRELPIDILKIDGTFSRDLASREGTSLMQAIVYLGKALGLQVIGEGVETAEQAAASSAWAATSRRAITSDARWRRRRSTPRSPPAEAFPRSLAAPLL
jgi:predicted signal transduction protein with EAL and GGDEF domain